MRISPSFIVPTFFFFALAGAASADSNEPCTDAGSEPSCVEDCTAAAGDTCHLSAEEACAGTCVEDMAACLEDATAYCMEGAAARCELECAPPPETDAGTPQEEVPDAGQPSEGEGEGEGETGEGCTLTQGYWKNHEESWAVSSLTLGGVSYGQSELLDLLRTPPAGGDVSLILSHQLIAAMLNVASGAAFSGSGIDDANAWLAANADGDGRLPFGVHGDADATALASALDDFNNGLTGPGHCDGSNDEDDGDSDDSETDSDSEVDGDDGQTTGRGRGAMGFFSAGASSCAQTGTEGTLLAAVAGAALLLARRRRS